MPPKTKDKIKPASSGGKALFDCSNVREAITLRWENEQYRRKCEQQIKVLEDTPVPGGPPGMTVSRLEMIVLDTVDELKDNFEVNPWHNTLNIVTYDLPIKSSQLLKWAEKFVNKAENDGARERIIKNIPAMANHPETETYMTQMMLPFRSVVVSQVVAAVMDACMGNDDIPAPKELPTKPDSSSKQVDLSKHQASHGAAGIAQEKQVQFADEKGKSLDKKHKKLFPAHVHAAHHAKDIDDVMIIVSFVPRYTKELRKHIAEQKKNKICTRFAEYNLFYMTSPEDTDDTKWMEALMPFAKAGLAHAQYDVAQCCLGVKREEEALAWFERAAKIGHSKAMLSLAKLHLTKAFAAVKYMNHGGEAKVKYSTSKHTKEALKWLDILCDADWDETTADDTEEGQKLLTHLESEAAALERANANNQAEVKAKKLKRFLYFFGAAVVLVLSLWYAISDQRDPLLKVSEPEEPTHVEKHVNHRNAQAPRPGYGGR